MKLLLVSLPLHYGDDPLSSDVFNTVEAWPHVAVFYMDIFGVDYNFGFFVRDRLSKQLLLVRLQRDFILFARITVLRLHLANLFKR